MKKLLPFFIVTTLSISLFAQQKLPNIYFTDWVHTPKKSGLFTYPAYDEPAPANFWTTGNPASHVLTIVKPTVLKSTDSYSSPYAVKMTTLKYGTVGNNVTAGALVSGTYKGGIDPSKVIEYGKPWTGRPERFFGYYKYLPKGGDSCRAYVLLYKDNGSKKDTIGYAEFSKAMRTKTVTQYTNFDIPITYKSTSNPEKILIIFTSSANGENLKGAVGSEFYLDNLQLLYAGETSILEQKKAASNVVLYPNPCVTHLTINRNSDIDSKSIVKIYNASGQVVAQSQLELNETKFDVANWQAGLFTYTIEFQGKIITQGKFVHH